MTDGISEERGLSSREIFEKRVGMDEPDGGNVESRVSKERETKRG